MNFNNKVFNKWYKDANTEVNWHSSDSLETYQHNLKSNYELLLKHNWIDTSITYKFNSYGFRCEEFVDTDSIMFLGCSITQGIGLPVDTIFPSIVSKKLDLHCINLAIHGTSADTAFRLANVYLEKLKPKIVVSLLMFNHRIELLQPDNAYHFTGNWSMNGRNKLDADYRKFYIEFYEKWIEQPENAELNINKNLLAIQKMCSNLNIKYLNYGEQFINSSLHIEKEPSRARDLIHPGTNWHNKLSDIIVNSL